MKALQNETLPMPGRDPNLWQHLIGLLASIWPQLYAALMAFVVSLARGLQSGGRPIKSLLEAIICGCLTLAFVPVLDHFGLSQSLAVALGAAIAFLGTEWIRERAEQFIESVLKRWSK